MRPCYEFFLPAGVFVAGTKGTVPGMSRVAVPPAIDGHDQRRGAVPSVGGEPFPASSSVPAKVKNVGRRRRRFVKVIAAAVTLAVITLAPPAWLWADWHHERAADRYLADEPVRRRVGPAWAATLLGHRAYWLDRDVGLRFAAPHGSPAWDALGTFRWATQVWVGTGGDAADDAPADDWPTDGDLRGLCRLTRLRDVALVGLRTSDATLDCLRQLPELRSVRLADLPKVTDAGLAALADSAGLESLDLERLPVGNAGLAAVWAGDKPQLSVVYLDDLRVGDAGVRAVTRAPALRDLTLDHLPITDAALGGIGSAAHLTHLRIRAAGVTGAGFDQLAGLDELATADFRGCDLTDAGLRAVPPLRSLASVSLSGGGVTADGVRVLLGRCPAVRDVLLDGTAVDEAAAASLRRKYPAVRFTVW